MKQIYEKKSEIGEIKNLIAQIFSFDTKINFTNLKQIFIIMLILYYFDSLCHIQIEQDTFGHIITKILVY